MKSIYFKMVLAGCLAIVPAGILILYNDYQRLNRLLDQQLQEHFTQIGAELQTDLPPAEMTARFDEKIRRILGRFNTVSAATRMVQAGLYDKTTEEGVYRLTQNIQVDQGAARALLATNVFKAADFSSFRQVAPLRYAFTIPVPSSRSPEYIVFLQAVDETRPAYLRAAIIRNGIFWGLTFLAMLVFVAFVIHSEVKIPMKHLRNALSKKRKAALDPDDFGEFAELVRTLEEHRVSQEESSGDHVIDPDTGYHTELAAQKIYADARNMRQPHLIVFFKINYAEEYIKAFGRANRGAIKKLVVDALDAGLPKTAPRAVTDDFFFISGLDPKEFKKVVERCQHHFNEVILHLYELGQGKQTPIQTLSAFAIPNHDPAPDTFARAIELIQSNWDAATDPHRGGWAILNEDGLIETSSGARPLPLSTRSAHEVPPASHAEPPKKPHLEKSQSGDIIGLAAAPDSAGGDRETEDMDPALARKMFIVKLCRVTGVKPRLAAQVFSAGWKRPDLLLQTKIQELSAKAGVEAQEASELIANLRKVPKEKLAYEKDDYKEVFLTDVRMIRKIPRESLARWFEAGYRRIEDLRTASPDDLIKLDGTVPKEDIESVLAGIRGSAAR